MKDFCIHELLACIIVDLYELQFICNEEQFSSSLYEALPQTGCFTVCMGAHFPVLTLDIAIFSSMPGTSKGVRVPMAQSQTRNFSQTLQVWCVSYSYSTYQKKTSYTFSKTTQSCSFINFNVIPAKLVLICFCQLSQFYHIDSKTSSTVFPFVSSIVLYCYHNQLYFPFVSLVNLITLFDGKLSFDANENGEGSLFKYFTASHIFVQSYKRTMNRILNIGGLTPN